jgi:HAE1 family hydrophobic/amphiphilic exporter-1
VLAIGVVVDDAIVVVEAVHAKMQSKHLSPYRATKEVINEISGAIIAITLVMTAVFVPVTFLSGPVGTFCRQFGITMATSIVLSGVVALTLTPVLCALILKPHTGVKKRGPLARLLHLFDRGVEKVTTRYASLLQRIVTRRLLTMTGIAGFGVGILLVNQVLPSGFIPLEDQGMIYGILQTPPGSTIEYTNAKSHELQAIAKRIEGVHSVSSLAGYEVLTEGRGSNAGTCLINLKPWSERKLTSKQIIERLERDCRKISNVKLEFFEPPAVPGFGAAGGISER